MLVLISFRIRSAFEVDCHGFTRMMAALDSL